MKKKLFDYVVYENYNPELINEKLNAIIGYDK